MLCKCRAASVNGGCQCKERQAVAKCRAASVNGGCHCKERQAVAKCRAPTETEEILRLKGVHERKVVNVAGGQTATGTETMILL